MIKKSVEQLEKPTISIDEEKLIAAGFINSGKRKFIETVVEFSESLFTKTVILSDASSEESEREITSDYVKEAAYKIFAHPIKHHSVIYRLLVIVEYILSVGIGVGGSNLNSVWGVILFVLCFASAVLRFAYRKIKENE